MLLIKPFQFKKCKILQMFMHMKPLYTAKKDIQKLSRAPFKKTIAYMYLFTIKYNYYSMLDKHQHSKFFKTNKLERVLEEDS